MWPAHPLPTASPMRTPCRSSRARTTRCCGPLAPPSSPCAARADRAMHRDLGSASPARTRRRRTPGRPLFATALRPAHRPRGHGPRGTHRRAGAGRAPRIPRRRRVAGATPPRLDGLILQEGGHRSTFLPSVWAELPNHVTFSRSSRSRPVCRWITGARRSKSRATSPRALKRRVALTAPSIALPLAEGSRRATCATRAGRRASSTPPQSMAGRKSRRVQRFPRSAAVAGSSTPTMRPVGSRVKTIPYTASAVRA